MKDHKCPASECGFCGVYLCPHGATKTQAGVQVCIYCEKPPESLWLPATDGSYDSKSETHVLVCKQCYGKHIHTREPQPVRENKKDSQRVLRACRDILSRYYDGDITCEQLQEETRQLLEQIDRGQLTQPSDNRETKEG